MARMTQAQVRSAFIKANPGVRRRGKGGYWYRCARCGKWCGRPGSDNVRIADSDKMEVDHRVPWSKGGDDGLYNLVPLCKPCNRAKSNNQTGLETAATLIHATAQGHLGHQLSSMALAGVKNKLGIKSRRY